MIITASQIQWTADCEKALDRGDKKGLKSIRKKQVRKCELIHAWKVCTLSNVFALQWAKVYSGTLVGLYILSPRAREKFRHQIFNTVDLHCILQLQ